MLVVSMLLFLKENYPVTIIVSLLLLSEGILYITSFFSDIFERTTVTRYTLLLVSLTITTIGVLSVSKLKETAFQMIHRVITIYVGWITILYLGGSSYVHPLSFTISILYLIFLIFQ